MAAPVVVYAEWAVVHLFLASLGRVLANMLGAGFSCQDCGRLALYLVTPLLGLGSLDRVVCRAHLDEEEPFLCLGALVCDVGLDVKYKNVVVPRNSAHP